MRHGRAAPLMRLAYQLDLPGRKALRSSAHTHSGMGPPVARGAPPSQPLPEEAELTWYDGSAHPEPCLDDVPGYSTVRPSPQHFARCLCGRETASPLQLLAHVDTNAMGVWKVTAARTTQMGALARFCFGLAIISSPFFIVKAIGRSKHPPYAPPRLVDDNGDLPEES